MVVNGGDSSNCSGLISHRGDVQHVDEPWWRMKRLLIDGSSCGHSGELMVPAVQPGSVVKKLVSIDGCLAILVRVVMADITMSGRSSW